MLILTRRVNESIMIGDNIEIVLLSMEGNQSKLGINAPKNIPVHREEIYIKIKSEQQNNTKLT